jgi:hypothetical protein
MKELFNFLLLICFIVLAGLALVFARDLLRERAVEEASVYIRQYDQDNSSFPSTADFLVKYPDWAACALYCYSSDGNSYTITYKLNSYVPISGALGTPQYDSNGLFTGSYVFTNQ